LSLPSNARREFRNFVKGWGVMSHVCMSPHTSSNSREARGLKIGIENPYMDGSKVTVQIFDILPRSQDI